MTSLLLRNVTASTRNLYLDDGDLMVIPDYDKQRAVAKEPVRYVRFPDPRTSALCLLYLLFARPIYEGLLVLCHGPEKEVDSQLAFLTDGKQISNTRARDEFRKCYCQYVKVSLSAGPSLYHILSSLFLLLSFVLPLHLSIWVSVCISCWICEVGLRSTFAIPITYTGGQHRRVAAQARLQGLCACALPLRGSAEGPSICGSRARR
jgi:hypothetical protein